MVPPSDYDSDAWCSPCWSAIENVDGQNSRIVFFDGVNHGPWMKESSGSPSSNSHRECSGTTCMDDLSHKTLQKHHLFTVAFCMLIQAFLTWTHLAMKDPPVGLYLS